MNCNVMQTPGNAMSASPESDLYPPIEPYRSDFLAVSGGHRLAYELCGNPQGAPVVFLHGGPGAGCSPTHRRFFDPAVYRIVLFDQRGAGRSTPYASVENNTTADLVSDIEALRRHLGIERWLVFGGSWGSTLALAYAATHPEACTAMVLRGIWLCRPADISWWFDGIRIVYPEYWSEFSRFIPENERSNLLEAYWKRLADPDPVIHLPAARVWDNYETLCSTLLPGPVNRSASGPSRLALARLEAHYMRNAVFLRENELMEAVPRMRFIPCAIVHGRYDMLCPVDGALELAEAWPAASLTIVPDAGHSAFEPGIRKALVAATDKFRGLIAR
jgi:proline iminopeptidase